mmetsp:Transcript_46911/g.147021  ORF Transcript_46911/g.147021 Transcript_46911/m.147021 type:complete len:218 (-) Transcript_46911:7-660(-)
MVNDMYVSNRSGLSHHTRWAWKSHLSRWARGTRWALASSWTGGSRRALVSLGARSSILAGRPSFTLLPRLAIFSWRSILAWGAVLARRSLRTLRTVLPWRTWGTIWTSWTLRSCWTWLLGHSHQILDVLVEALYMFIKVLVPSRLLPLCQDKMVLNILQIPICIPCGLRLKFISIRELNRDPSRSPRGRWESSRKSYSCYHGKAERNCRYCQDSTAF